MVRPVLDVDLAALTRNFESLAALAPDAAPAPVVKCGGYGLGAAAVARTLAQRAGAACFFVAYPFEGADLRAALQREGLAPEIVVFNGAGDAEDAALCVDARLTPVVNSIAQAKLWRRAAPGAPCAVHVDTGMNRLGVAADEIDALLAADLAVDIVMSHFSHAATPDHPSLAAQAAAFAHAAERFPNARRSLSATGGVLAGAQFGFDLARLGIGLYGMTAAGEAHPAVEPVATLRAPVLQVRTAPAGETVGYDGTATLSRTSRLATLAVGYGDGLPRAASNRARVRLAGADRAITGRISMDLTVVDVTDPPETVADDDAAEIFGPHAPIERLAADVGTIGYEILTGLGPRAERRYL
ncbi:MAG: alanine racemase [Pseudomonadota bacterium]